MNPFAEGINKCEKTGLPINGTQEVKRSQTTTTNHNLKESKNQKISFREKDYDLFMERDGRSKGVGGGTLKGGK